MKKKIILISCFIILLTQVYSQKRIIPGAERMDQYLPLLKGKSVAIFANQTSMVHHTHLVDTLIKRGIKVVRIFGPEHGFGAMPMPAKKWEMVLIKKPVLK